MSDIRKLVPVDREYMSALGLATYAFARCEWQIVWCSEKIYPGSVTKIISEEMTAGTIGKHFTNITRSMPKSKERENLISLASEFFGLVKERNGIIHGKPCTAPNGEQRLSGNGIIEISHLEQAEEAFTVCNDKLNTLFYGFLQSYVPQQAQQGAQADGHTDGTSPLDKTAALNKLKQARDAFWFSLGGYALLTEEPARSIIPNYEIQVQNDDISVVPKGVESPSRRGMSYTISFNSALDPLAVRSVIDRTMRFMLVESFEVTRSYARAQQAMDALTTCEWFYLAKHLRDAYAHGGRWNLRDKRQLPTTWRRLTVDASMDGQSVEGFIGWFDALQLGASMNAFVSGQG